MCSEEDVFLVPFERGHMTEEYRSWFFDKEVTKYNSHGLFPYTKQAMEDFILKIETGSTTDLIFAVMVQEVTCDLGDTTGKTDRYTYTHVGNVSIQKINYVNRSAELAWVIGNSLYWGRGIATKAGKAMLRHCFDHLNLNRVWTGTARSNKGMLRVCRKLGMTLEGYFREGMYLKGEYQDVVALGILKREFAQEREDVNDKQSYLESARALANAQNLAMDQMILHQEDQNSPEYREAFRQFVVASSALSETAKTIAVWDELDNSKTILNKEQDPNVF